MITSFDQFIYTAVSSQNVHPVYKYFMDMLKTLKVDVAVWKEWPSLLKTGKHRSYLKEQPVKLWSLNQPFYLCTPGGITFSHYRPAIVDALECAKIITHFNMIAWQLDGILVFKDTDSHFEAIPLISTNGRDKVMFPEIQLCFKLTDDGWTWRKSTTGFVNALVYDVLEDDFNTQCAEEVLHSIDWLAPYMLSYLGTYDDFIAVPGQWAAMDAKPPRYKEKNGKIKKIYRIASAGYRQYIQEIQ